MDARADLDLRWVYVRVVGVDVLLLILQSMRVKNVLETVCHYFNFLSFAGLIHITSATSSKMSFNVF